jgi:hypothetical protein
LLANDETCVILLLAVNKGSLLEFFIGSLFFEALPLLVYLKKMSKKTFILVELSTGYSIWEKTEVDEIGQELESIQKNILNLADFKKMIKLVSFTPFNSAGHALENIMNVSEGRKI